MYCHTCYSCTYWIEMRFSIAAYEYFKIQMEQLEKGNNGLICEGDFTITIFFSIQFSITIFFYKLLCMIDFITISNRETCNLVRLKNLKSIFCKTTKLALQG